MKVIAVLVTYNSKKVIVDCIESMKKQRLSGVIVVDNNSTDGTRKLVKKHNPRVKIIALDDNIGYASGNNLGIKYALLSKPDFILIQNPDTILLKDSLKHLLMYAETHVATQILGPKIYKYKKKQRIWSLGGELDKKRYTAKLIGIGEKDSGQFDTSREVDFISGTCMLIPRELLEKGLRFYEPYFMYYEDVEFCLRARKLGYPSICVPEAEIVHSEPSKDNDLKNYYLARNHLLFVERNAPFRVKLRELVRLPKTLSEHYQSKNYLAITGIKDYWLRRFGRYDKN